MKILSFPSPCWRFEATANIPKNCQTSPIHLLGVALVIRVPIQIKIKDMLIVDIRDGHIEVIEREGIAIWRAAWKN